MIAYCAAREKEAQGADDRSVPTPAPPASSPDAPANGLGTLDVGRYLAAHGITYKTKSRGDATLYVLGACLFDSNHKDGVAAIVAGTKGLIYHCFHTSCTGRTWAEARHLISGDKKLTEWMEGYDPNWKKKKKKEEKALALAGGNRGSVSPPVGGSDDNPYARVDNLINNDWPQVVSGDGRRSPTPAEIDPALFFMRKGDRTEFVPRRAANYAIEQFFPIACSLGQFWRYLKGVWKFLPTEEITALLSHALKDQVKGKMIENVVTLLKGLLYVSEDSWEPNPYLINIQNGMYDINAGVLLEHSPAYRSRVQLQVEYLPGAPVFGWYEFLKSIMPEDHKTDDQGQYIHHLEKHALLQQFGGYCLLRDCRFQKALFLFGSGSNGKSTFIKVLGSVLGKENTAALSLSSLNQNFMTISLHNKLANLANETNPKAMLESEIFNSCVTGDEMQARNLYSQYVKFNPFCKFIISMNEPPQVPDKSYAFQRRIFVVNFNRRFTPKDIDPLMFEKLMDERAGIFNWMVDGLKMLLKNNGFRIGESVKQDTDKLITRVNPLITFAEECCDFIQDVETRVQDLVDAYRDWCQDGGNKPLGKIKFLDQFESQFPKIKRKKGTGENADRHVFMGIRLRQQELDDIRARLAARRRERWENWKDRDRDDN